MANTTFLDQPIATSLDGTEVLPIIQPPNSTAGVSKRVTVGMVASLASTTTGSLAPFLMATNGATATFPGSRFLVTDPDFASTDGGAGAAFTIGPIATAAVTYAKFQQVPGLSLVGVSGTATGIVGAITAVNGGDVLQVNPGATALVFGSISTASFSSTVWPVPNGGTGRSNLTAFAVLLGNNTSAVTTSNVGGAGQLFVGQTSTSNPAFVTISGDVGFTAAGTATISTSAVTSTKLADFAVTTQKIDTAAVTFVKFQTMTGLSVFGVAGTATGVGGLITGTANQVLVVNPGGTAVIFGQVNLSSTSAVTGTLSTARLTGVLLAANNLSDVASVTTSRANLLGSIGPGVINGALSLSVATGALTIALKTQLGTDPSTASPVSIGFRNTTASTGDYTVLNITGTSSLVITSGSTLGGTAATALRVWVVGFNDSGTFRIGAINCRSGTSSVFPLGSWPIASAVSEGGAGGADSAQVFYSDATITTKPYVILGYGSWETGLTTAGVWTASPTRVQLVDHSTPLPGRVVQYVSAQSVSQTNTTSTTYVASSLGASITPSSAANVIGYSICGAAFNGNDALLVQMFRNATGVGPQGRFSNTGGGWVPLSILALDAPNTASSVTYTAYLKGNNGTTTVAFPDGSGAVVQLSEIFA